MDIWGWIVPVATIFGKAASNWARRRRLGKMMDSPRYPEGRNLEALRRVAGEAHTDTGRERTRELLRGVKRGRRQARELMRKPGSPEMWGLRYED
jgi:hypothetical protein